MMSHYGLPYEFSDHWICGSLELSIETLTGTAFEIKVSPNDTIMSIKSKIQSVEGIPVSQQHLLYNLEELDNSASVSDYSIRNGSTLKLVLSMKVGPISTKRLPPVDEIAWRELQELMCDTQRDDFFEKLPSGSKVTVLIFRNGEQVNLIRVIENDDGSFSPLSESWNGTSIKNLFAEEDPEESAKRLQENSVTMGKVQELKEKLESLSIQRKEKKCEESSKRESNNSQLDSEAGGKNENRKTLNFIDSPTTEFTGQPTLPKPVRRSERSPDGVQGTFRPRRRLVPFPNVPVPGLHEARKEAETIIRMQSKLSVLVDSEPGPSYGFKRPPLPEIRRSSSDGDTDNKKLPHDEKPGKSVRKKTTRSFAILEEEMNDLTPTPSICSSQSSIVALPSSEEVAAAIAFSPVSRDRVSTTVNRSRYKLSRYVLANDERPKTTPGKLDHGREGKAEEYCTGLVTTGERESSPSPCPPPQPLPLLSSAKRASHILATLTNMFPTRGTGIGEGGGGGDDGDSDRGRTPSTIRKPSCQEQLLRAVTRPKLTTTTTTIAPTSCTTTTTSGSTSSECANLCSVTSATTSFAKKRLRCSQCRKKLNITNSYNCRCGGLFCAIHRYSEVHDCLFDYKQEGRKLLQQMNPLIAASKLPKI